jgi:uncharacterized protein DUF742
MGAPAEGEPADKPARVRAGARFPSAKQLEKFTEDESVQSSDGTGARHAARSRPPGARFPSEKQLEKFTEEETELPAEPEPELEPEPPKPSPRPRRPPEPDLSDDTDEPLGPRVRPYVLTGGRTQSSYELGLETMVSLRADARWTGRALNAEYQPVRALCASPQSVAEVAVALSVPLGVARVLLSDMAELGLLHIHGTERTAEGRPPMALMRRVLDGLQRL